MKVDNFALTMFQACPLKYKTRILDHWTTRGKSAALGFGGALHEGLAAWYRHGSIASAIKAIDASWSAATPVDDYRNKAKCIATMIEYVRHYDSEAFRVVGAPDNPLVECTFTLDTGLYLSCRKCGPLVGAWNKESTHCVNCSEPLEKIEYGGIFDGLIEFSGSVYVLEHKTTSQLGTYYFSQFKPNNQISGYVWGGGQMSGQRVGGAIVNAIGVYKASATKFERQITTRSKENIAEWLESVRYTCEQIQACDLAGVWPMHTGACTLYGKCEFYDVHVLGTENERQKMLEQQYVREEWEYENRSGVKEE